MANLQLTQAPIAKAEMLIRKPVAEVFAAFVDPETTSRFWFTKSTGRLETGKHIVWTWEMYGMSIEVDVKAVEPNKRILLEWGNYGSMTTVEWVFTPFENDTTRPRIKRDRRRFSPRAEEAMSFSRFSLGTNRMRVCFPSPFWEKNRRVCLPSPFGRRAGAEGFELSTIYFLICAT